ncbi:cytochrome P450 [Frankia sp. CNm7]|uniref:Cytochrome P450 n=2 Tax=Frankia nepalensis TaxID=1836974 RepID=A0A937RIC9_9ACTN|nr:cytochrome P450 [Frankia nepalensis]MBL7498991.1 cytochrome P450 [Frankia nepalensis]MBL7511489.1 cytochrome P450 [Frankia nepalensis]MBL7520705.1 cytochrome P450 [Frankia nepalensis]MBL7630732.1 cytochrome P450 [Frankia nepalensis]
MATDRDQVYWDPWDVDIYADPYPTFRRLRDEAPLYYNERHDFFAVSRYDDVERGLHDKETFTSGRGAILELIKANVQLPPGTLIFEDPPRHTVYRNLLSRVFTPRRMNALEPQVREYCAASLDPLTGADRFDFIADLGAQMPVRVIGMLLGIPLQDQDAVRETADANLRTKPGAKMSFGGRLDIGADMFAEYIDWRAKHPSDDLMTDLLNAEFVDESGVSRRLSREEVLTYVAVIAGAGSETTTRLIGWAGKLLADHPDQRADLVRDRSLIPRAIEEILRFEPPASNVARYVARDTEFHGTPVPEGAAISLLVGSANRDERHRPDGDSFNIHRAAGPSLSFGHGAHFCLGASLARVEGRVALEEILRRFPEWDIDTENAKLASTATVRGWETLPAFIR